MKHYKIQTPLRLLKETADGNGVEEIQEETCDGCGALMKPRTAAQLNFIVRPDDEAPEETEDLYFICPNGCAQCSCRTIIPLNAACPDCSEINHAH